MTLAIYSWFSGNDPIYLLTPTFNQYSMSYTALVQFVILLIICNKSDMAVFMTISSFGVIFVVTLMICIIAVGVIALTNTSF